MVYNNEVVQLIESLIKMVGKANQNVDSLQKQVSQMNQTNDSLKIRVSQLEWIIKERELDPIRIYPTHRQTTTDIHDQFAFHL